MMAKLTTRWKATPPTQRPVGSGTAARSQSTTGASSAQKTARWYWPWATSPKLTPGCETRTLK